MNNILGIAKVEAGEEVNIHAVAKVVIVLSVSGGTSKYSVFMWPLSQFDLIRQRFPLIIQGVELTGLLMESAIFDQQYHTFTSRQLGLRRGNLTLFVAE